ncbi:arginine-specific carbamoyl-phosphate synthase large chain [Gracilibacillus halophilus YIM-C55.5]|uniref:Carbamoyl phosphate synthase large chain n=1 Tax=Gracilibacillus halophilus YIM-C55.5 TaxID=1308866 RepID=N4WB54_9BACI|nr:carbamoyl-phosphate synthase (glutamine-hydrolyzing) large subunit [Gracilibacillus halophilus]ENH96484.1 arginine-specific carbamoyl-phosphate synthase large chain [Gracilibacillus halophilus YIM-C55.5]
MPKIDQLQKVLVIGSGPIIIGQAAEFDYAGTQACLALKEDGVEVVLVNNNPATIMTDENIADKVYLEPLTCESITNIIEKEQPDGILPTLGGQTGLNMAVLLDEAGVLEKYDVTLLGTPLETIQKGEDREIFKSMMKDINEPIAESLSVSSIDEAIDFANQVGYSLIVRPAYTLGGAGGGIANNEDELRTIVKNGLHYSPINQVLIEQSVKGWKEVEYEVMRDENDTCIIVCNMENFDPVGVHTGDSIVVAPSQTLTDRQYQMLRTSSCRVIRELGVIGGCNIQFALNPESDEYIIIEVNPRVSRSSALASKATGYPIARIAAKLALGYHLDEVKNPITGDTYASFEPAIDYIAAKIPRWPFDKFTQADRLLGTQMKATGEVMALARNLPAAINKAVRSLEIGLDSLHLPGIENQSDQELQTALVQATDERIFAVAEALRRGMSVEDIFSITQINQYFLHELHAMVEKEKQIAKTKWQDLTANELKEAKEFGLADSTLANLLDVTEDQIRQKQSEAKLAPSYKMVDTCAAEFSAETPYFYSSWNEFDEVESLKGNKRMVVLGSGPIRIGQGVEFDYCSVHAAKSLQAQGVDAVVVNNNPETVSTDFNTADHLYFEPLTVEDVLHIVKKEKAQGVLVQFGGQTAINLAEGLQQAGVSITGTELEAISAVEDREQFYQLLSSLDIPHIPGDTVMATEDAKAVAEKIGYPILLRPSYVIGGQGMVILYNEQQLVDYLSELQTSVHDDRIFPLLIDRFIEGYEVEVDAICDGKDVLIPGIFEHTEKAGVHSGDSVATFPAPNLTDGHKQTIEAYTQKISSQLNVKGIMNIQFVLSEDRQTVYVLEVNPRASRTVPIASKVTGVPMVDLATRVQMGESLDDQGWKLGLHEDVPYYAVKMPIFSSNKLPGVDPVLGPEMKSTGEAIGMGSTVDQAMAKAFGWAENSMKALTKDDTIFVSFDSLTASVIDQLKDLSVTVDTDEATTDQLANRGISNINRVSLSEAKQKCMDEAYALICDTHRSGERDQHVELREAALKSDTKCFTSNDTFKSYLQVMDQDIEFPQSMQQYRESQSPVNQKERVVR